MKVTNGWSAEVSSGEWDKSKVTIEEEDWESICVESEIVGIPVSLTTKFELMEVEAKRFVAAHVASSHPNLKDDAVRVIHALNERKAQLIFKVKDEGFKKVVSSE